MENSILSSLPNELFNAIFQHLDTPSCAALAGTCLTLNSFATPYLYESADIQLGKSNEFVRTVKDKHANLVRHLTVTTWVEISPCRVVPCLENLVNLQSLSLEGGYWMWDSPGGEWGEGEKWETLEGLLWDYIERASLKQPAETRVAGSLRSLTLNRYECNGQGAALHSPILFSMPQLRDLTLCGFTIDEEDGEIEPQFQRQTDLKSLRFDRCFVSFPALRGMLLAPRALTYLAIGHTDALAGGELREMEVNDATVAEFVEALLPHRLSLKEIKVVVTDALIDREPVPTINDSSFYKHAVRFPVLKRWLGCDKSSLSYFLNDFADSEDGE